MSLVLGIDTGGTYTDGVIIDPISKEVLCKAKALTTKHDLMIGISQCLDLLDQDLLHQIKLVCLSTTLATNAIVEGRGGNVGLLISGSDIENILPDCEKILLQGRLDIRGKVVEDIDEKEVRHALGQLLRKNIDAIAVSAFASIRNPLHELQIKDIIESETQLPVVCAHDLSSLLGFNERTITAVLNAKLLPVINALIHACRNALEERKISAKLMVVKGDGNLIDEKSALHKPIETILSGPAASIIGGRFLSGLEHGLIVDIGGTTTDIANLEYGAVKIRKDGAKVGGWHTQILAADIRTYGLGGDSYVKVDAQGQVRVGPQRVNPLSRLAIDYPYLIDELAAIDLLPGFELFAEQEIDCFSLLESKKQAILVGQDRSIADLLKQGPHSAKYLAEQLNRDIEGLNLTQLQDRGIIERSSLTPSDVLLYLGKYNQGNKEIVRVVMQFLAKKSGMAEQDFADYLLKRIHREFALSCMQSIVDFENKNFNLKDSKGAAFFIASSFGDSEDQLLHTRFTLNKPLIAVGAPAGAWIADTSNYLHTKAIVPSHAEVANAVGAAVGQVMEYAEALIRPNRKDKTYTAFLPKYRKDYDSLEEAKQESLKALSDYVVSLVNKQSHNFAEAYQSVDDVYIKSTSAGEEVYIETKITATAVGSPEWLADMSESEH